MFATLRKLWHPGGPAAALLAAALLAVPCAIRTSSAKAADTTLTIASMNDPFGAAMTKLAPAIAAKTGVGVTIDIMGYGELMTKTTADFVGKTKAYDIVTMDIVLAGQYAAGDRVLPLGELMKCYF